MCRQSRKWYNIFIKNAGNRNFISIISSNVIWCRHDSWKIDYQSAAKINTHQKKKRINKEAINVDFENILDNVGNILNGKITQGEIRLAVKILMNNKSIVP